MVHVRRPHPRAHGPLTVAIGGLILAGCGATAPAGPPEEVARDASPPRPPAAHAARGTSSYEITDVTPAGAQTAWALTAGNQLRDPRQAVVRTGDGGARWSNVTPPGLARAGQRTTISDLDVLGPRRAWLTDGRYEVRQELLRTADGGRSWTRVGVTPAGCEPQFINARDGWCVGLHGAAGSMVATIDHTRDGGRRWQRVERTGLEARGGPTQIPFACDKSVSFVSPRTGFAVSVACASGEGYVYRSTDAGRSWRRTLWLPRPRGQIDGSQLTPVVTDGRHAAVGVIYPRAGKPSRALIFTSADGGLRWSPVRPPASARVEDLDLVGPGVWRMAAGRELEATDDGGRVWTRLRANVNLTAFGELSFMTPNVGWDVDLTGDTPVVLHTSDGGTRWRAIRVPER